MNFYSKQFPKKYNANSQNNTCVCLLKVSCQYHGYARLHHGNLRIHAVRFTELYQKLCHNKRHVYNSIAPSIRSRQAPSKCASPDFWPPLGCYLLSKKTQVISNWTVCVGNSHAWFFLFYQTLSQFENLAQKWQQF